MGVIEKIKKHFDAKTRNFDQQIQKLQQEKQTKLMEATLDQKDSINNEYADLIAKIDMQKNKMNTIKDINIYAKRGGIQNKKRQIKVEKTKNVIAKYKLLGMKSKLQNEISALSEKQIQKQIEVTKLMKEHIEMFESKIDDERKKEIIKQKRKFLETELFVTNIFVIKFLQAEFSVNIEVLEESYKFLMELKNNCEKTPKEKYEEEKERRRRVRRRRWRRRKTKCKDKQKKFEVSI